MAFVVTGGDVIADPNTSLVVTQTCAEKKIYFYGISYSEGHPLSYHLVTPVVRDLGNSHFEEEICFMAVARPKHR
jgi:hypothetical protein